MNCRIVRFAPFANRLASSLPPHIQFLRCLTNYEALRFSIPITTLAKSLVERMTLDSSGSGGKYVSVHLRFEEVCTILLHSFYLFFKYFYYLIIVVSESVFKSVFVYSFSKLYAHYLTFLYVWFM